MWLLKLSQKYHGGVTVSFLATCLTISVLYFNMALHRDLLHYQIFVGIEVLLYVCIFILIMATIIIPSVIK